MSLSRQMKWALIAAVVVVGGWTAYAQSTAQPTNDAPNPYQTIDNYFKLPEGRKWGSTSAIDIARDGRSIWVAERCGANTCLDRAAGQMSNLDPILLFDQSGKLVRSFGAGMLIFPHGIHVDRDGNLWITDGQDNAPAPARGDGGGRGAAAGGGAPGAGAAAGGGQGGGRGPAPTAPPANATKGHQVFKFSPEGKVLLTIGRPGGATGPDQCCWQPNDVITNEKGEIFIAEGHGQNPNDRIVVFGPDGKKIVRQFGRRGSGPGEFNGPHALAFDAQGRLYVGDRSNNRTQILDQNGTFIAEWAQFSRPSGLFIDRNGMLYSADSESGSVNPAHGAWKRGIRIGSVKDGKVTTLIPDPSGEGVTFAMKDGKPVLTKADGTPGPGGTLAAEGVAVDAAGNIYGAEVGPQAVKKYVKK
jgi:NHL repeat-containing protein